MNEVVIKDIQMPFLSMVTFMVKWTLAAIPAMIMIAILIGVLTAILGGMFGMGA